MVCCMDLHIFLYILTLKILYIDYLLSVLEIKLCTDFKCVNTGHVIFFFNLFLQKSSHMFTFQRESCNEEAIKLL